MLRERLEADGHQLIATHDRDLAISGRVLRSLAEPLVAIEGDAKLEDQIGAFIEALYWRHQHFPDRDELRFVFGPGKHADKVAAALSTVGGSVSGMKVQIEGPEGPVDLRPWSPPRESKWLRDLQARDEAVSSGRPAMVDELDDLVGRETFCWYLSLTMPYWSGRVEGLDVCKVRSDGTATLSVGKIGSTGQESVCRAIFREVAGQDQLSVPADTRVEDAAGVIRELADRYVAGTLPVPPEHALESKILRGAVQVQLAGTHRPPVIHYGQFPTRWWPGGDPRYSDALLQGDGIPWVVELKVPEGGGQAGYYRRGLGQVVLYREFIRNATTLHPWFEEKELDAKGCRAALVIPKLRGPKAADFGKSLRALAACLDVELCELAGTAPSP